MIDQLRRVAHPENSMKKRLLWALLATVCFSLLANGYAYFNFYPIHDAVDFTIGGPFERWQVKLGRFLIPLYMMAKGPISMPWLTGLLSMLYLGLSVFIIAELLGQRSGLEISLTAGFLSANLFTLETNTAQQYFSDIFLFALLFACLGVYCIWKGTGRWRLAASVGCFFISFGMYQAFITTAACLCVLAALREGVQGEGLSKRVLCRLLLSFVLLAASGAIYFLASRLALRIIGREPSDAGWSIYTAGNHSIDELWKSAQKQYELFVSIFFDGRGYVGHAFGLATCLLAAIGVVLTVLTLRRRLPTLLLLVVLALLFPLASRLVNVFTKMNGAFRTMFSQFLLWPILLALIFWSLPKEGRLRLAVIGVTTALSLAIIGGNIRNNNGAFTVQRVLYDRAMYHTGRLMEDLEEFDTTKEIALVGRFKLESPREELLERYKYINGFGNSTGADTRYTLSKYTYLLGYDLKWAKSYEKKVRDLPEVKEMPTYPEPGYIREIGDYLVVRLS